MGHQVDSLSPQPGRKHQVRHFHYLSWVCAFLLCGPVGLPQRNTEELCHSQHQVPHYSTLQVSTSHPHPISYPTHHSAISHTTHTISSTLLMVNVYLHCSNGIGHSGIFITLHIVLERMVAEGLVDVFQTIKNLRIQRPAMVQTLVRYCYVIVTIPTKTSIVIGHVVICN